MNSVILAQLLGVVNGMFMKFNDIVFIVTLTLLKSKLEGGDSHVVLAEGKGSRNGGICFDHCVDCHCCYHCSHRPWNSDLHRLQPDFVRPGHLITYFYKNWTRIPESNFYLNVV